MPERPDRARERARRRRALLALRRGRRGAEHGAVVLQDHGIRRRAARGPRDDRLARAHEEDPDELDRPLRGRGDPLPRRGARHRHPCLHDATRHALRRDVLRDRARVAARAAARPTTRRCSSYARVAAARPTEEREQRKKTGVFTGRYATNPVERRADPDLGLRLRADGVRHRRADGGAGARRARRRVRGGVRPAGRARDRRRRQADQLGRVRRSSRPRGEGRRSSTG